MVLQKKSDPKGKQQTPAKPKSKKVFEQEEEDSDMEFDMNSDDDDSESDGDTSKKSPLNKSVKSKLPQSDKKVSFQIPGKNTPKNENLVVKKQATPAKTLKEFEGMLAKNTPNKNGKLKKRDQEEDDDDDDDDDDDADLDMMLGGEDGDDDDDEDDNDDDDDDEDDNDDDDDDEDDNDDDDDDDDDNEDDDEDDDEEEKQKSNKNAKQLNQSKNSMKNVSNEKPKTPAKNPEKPKNLEKSAKKGDKSPKDISQTPAKVSTSKKNLGQETPIGVKKGLEVEAERIRERDLRTLWVGNLPNDISPAELKTLSSDILNVKMPHSQNLKKRKNVYAFLEFANESKAEENYKILSKKKLRNEILTIDFSGERSKKRQNVASSQASDRKQDFKRLYVTSLPLDATMDQVAKFFPKAYQIFMNIQPTYRSATVHFMDEKDAAQSLEDTKSAKISGSLLTVVYSNPTAGKKSNKRKKGKGRANDPPAKKIKFEAKQDSDDDSD